MDVWVPLVSAALGALAGLAGAWLVTRGQSKGARRSRLEDAYAAVLVAGHNAEIYLRNSAAAGIYRVRLTPDLERDLARAAASVALLGPLDTHQATDAWISALIDSAIWDEIEANDVRPNTARWTAAINLMRRDLAAKD